MLISENAKEKAKEKQKVDLSPVASNIDLSTFWQSDKPLSYGDGGIRTHVPVARQNDFESFPLRPLRYVSGTSLL